ncbi:MAG: four helix bundle protein [Bacteroidetes bacterium]|nr:four helix bundle protein [Bacteroidota bacterium]
MATIKRFEDIEAWQQARVLCSEVYKITNEGPFVKDYKLRDQINGSSGSVMDNIAEGYERDGRKEFIQFLSIAKASCGEVRSQLYRAIDRNYITKERFEDLYNMSNKIGKMISGLMTYLKGSDYSGTKFNEPIVPYANQPET